MREAGLSRSPGYLHKEIASSRLGKSCYRALTVQPGTAMTVKEIGPVRVTASAFFRCWLRPEHFARQIVVNHCYDATNRHML